MRYSVSYVNRRGTHWTMYFGDSAALEEFVRHLPHDAVIHEEDDGDRRVVGRVETKLMEWQYERPDGKRVIGEVTRKPRRTRVVKLGRPNRIDVVNTSRYGDGEVAALVELARGRKHHGHVALNVKNSKYACRGRAYERVPSESMRRVGSAGRFLVVAAIGAPELFPFDHRYPGLSTAPEYRLESWQEGLVTLVAHELQHCQQYALGLPRSEIDAERAAVRALAAYRARVTYTDCSGVVHCGTHLDGDD